MKDELRRDFDYDEILTGLFFVDEFCEDVPSDQKPFWKKIFSIFR